MECYIISRKNNDLCDDLLPDNHLNSDLTSSGGLRSARLAGDLGLFGNDCDHAIGHATVARSESAFFQLAIKVGSVEAQFEVIADGHFPLAIEFAVGISWT